jgi:hypothetical protein
MPATSLHEAALGFLLAHQGEHLHHDRQQLLARCADHLQQQHDCTANRAMVTTVQAMGEVDARGTAAHIDISASTSFAVFVRDPASGLTYAFTAGDLLRLGRSCPGASANALH